MPPKPRTMPPKPPKPRTRANSAAAIGPTADATSTDFETFVRRGITDIQNKLDSFETSLEFQSQRTTELEQRMTPLESYVKELEKKVGNLEGQIKKVDEAENRLERFSRRNNIRIVGLEKESDENPLSKVTKVLEDFFGMKQPRIERAHRDGRATDGNPQHMLVKLLSFQDKRVIMTRRREVLKDQSFFIIDLTKKDLEQKRKYAKEAEEAYRRGNRLYFSAGKWRSKSGLADFYTSNTNFAAASSKLTENATESHPLE